MDTLEEEAKTASSMPGIWWGPKHDIVENNKFWIPRYNLVKLIFIIAPDLPPEGPGFSFSRYLPQSHLSYFACIPYIDKQPWVNWKKYLNCQPTVYEQWTWFKIKSYFVTFLEVREFSYFLVLKFNLLYSPMEC